MANNGVCISMLLLALVLLTNAWVADDAYITFRVVDNFVHGYGLRWNVDERVQVYTHPLWMLAHIPLYALFGNIYLSTIGFSLALALLSVNILRKALPLSPAHAAVLMLLPALFSKTFHDHAVSGLETPMLMLWFALFWHALHHRPEATGRICLLASLLLLTRLDMAVLVALPLLYTFRKNRWPLRSLLQFWPLALWFAFSLFY
ncbi:MAG: hypothetical protein K2Q01_07620, partial [Rickettsiales bacterium]|nr:hypothetical protein [Rickettsiales bacterium]